MRAQAYYALAIYHPLPGVVLRVLPRIAQLTVLAQHYHPDNQESGDAEMFSLVLEAYRTLNDPERRAGYDVDHRSFAASKWRIFEDASGLHDLEGERRKRIGILSLLRAKRIESPSSPQMTIFELEELLGCPREHLELSLWYLKETGRISRTDNGRYLLTAIGLDMLEEQAEPCGGRVRLLAAPRAANA